ncbi:unnamed protein product [Linum tenue]|uniref:Uncharacterized protein n=1 Tax=Linum tenue TaxID=586396 RepID=A0AAV0JLK7_9ROSI|nr:unnamed protein product [Linum tenue]
MESKRSCRRRMVAVVVLSLVAAATASAGPSTGDQGGSGWAWAGHGVALTRPSAACTGCYRGCFSECMADKGDQLNTIDPFVCSAECFVHCIFSFYMPPLSAHSLCTAGCSVSRCSKFSYIGHPNTGEVGSCMDACSIGCTKKHDQFP